jgi:F-type H+-transporting ATPase subunit delta
MATIDLRYARALALVVSDQKMDVIATQGELNSFADILAESAELREVLDNPSIPESQKVGVLNALGDRAGLSHTIRNFIAVIARHGRIHQMREIANSYAALADQETQIAEVEISSAHPLDEGLRKLLEKEAVRLSGGDKIKTTYYEDASLLGGAVVKIGSTVYDGSVRTQLQQLKQRMVAAGTR